MFFISRVMQYDTTKYVKGARPEQNLTWTMRDRQPRDQSLVPQSVHSNKPLTEVNKMH